MTKYVAKPIIIAKAAAEVTVLAALIALPLLLKLLGRLDAMPFVGQIVLGITCVVGMCLIPWYGWMILSVTLDDEGISTWAIFEKQAAQWWQVRSLTRRSSWNSTRFVVTLGEGELTLPIWMKNGDEMIATIKEHLPVTAPSRKANRVFSQDQIGQIFQLINALAGVLFIIISWFFFASMISGNKSINDVLLVALFCLLMSVIMAWRTLVILLSPLTVEVVDPGIKIHTLFFKRDIPWEWVRAVGRPLPFLPEGSMIKTAVGDYLIGTHMDCGDELCDIVASKMPEPPENNNKGKDKLPTKRR